jgi:hypothetical protein
VGADRNGSAFSSARNGSGPSIHLLAPSLAERRDLRVFFLESVDRGIMQQGLEQRVDVI